MLYNDGDPICSPHPPPERYTSWSGPEGSLSIGVLGVLFRNPSGLLSDLLCAHEHFPESPRTHFAHHLQTCAVSLINGWVYDVTEARGWMDGVGINYCNRLQENRGRVHRPIRSWHPEQTGRQDYRNLHGSKDFLLFFPSFIEKILALKYSRTTLLKSISSLYLYMNYRIIFNRFIFRCYSRETEGKWERNQLVNTIVSNLIRSLFE